MPEQCEVMYCGKAANLGGLCLFHRKKDIAGGLEYDGDTIWDLCSRGHRWTPENTRIESNSDGSKRRRCRFCLREKAAAKKDEEPVVEAPQPIRLTDPVMRGAFDTFDKVQEHVTAKCRDDPGPYVDYDADHIPTDVEAAKLCAGCPMLAACGNSAAATKPGWGVWGGTPYVYGEPYDGDRARLDEDD